MVKLTRAAILPFHTSTFPAMIFVVAGGTDLIGQSYPGVNPGCIFPLALGRWLRSNTTLL
jgi:hypothetical protein